MFEKEAEEWVKNNLHSTEEDYIKAFKDGAEFGFQKGIKAKINTTTISDCPIKDEWHYVKDGDLTKELAEKRDWHLLTCVIREVIKMASTETLLQELKDRGVIRSWCYNGTYHVGNELPKESADA